MLATLGFTITGLFLGIFAYTFNKLVVGKAKLKLNSFSYAYYCAAIAFLVWGVAAAFNQTDWLNSSVLLGDTLLLLGTIFMLETWLGEKNGVWLWVGTLVAVVLLFVRANRYPPMPYMDNGILIFNTQRVVAIGLGLIFVLIWLPVSLRVAKLVTHKIKQDRIASLYSSIYGATVLAALVFLAARKTVTVALSFVAISICVLMLIRSNFLVAKLMEKHHAK